MQNEKMLEILRRIQICLERDSLDLARELIQLEIDNINGATEQRCKNTKYYFYNWYCDKCSNLNCESNKNK